MKRVLSILHRIQHESIGVLSFEWVLLAVLLIIGLVGGMAAFRDTAILKFGGIASAAGRLDQSCGYDGCPYLEGSIYTDTRARQTTIVTAE